MGPPPTSNQMAIIADIDNNRFAVLAADDDEEECDEHHIVDTDNESEDEEAIEAEMDECEDDQATQQFPPPPPGTQYIDGQLQFINEFTNIDTVEEINAECETDEEREEREFQREREQDNRTYWENLPATAQYPPTPAPTIQAPQAQFTPPPPGMHYNNGQLEYMAQASPLYQRQPKQFKRQVQVVFSVSTNYKGQHPLPQHVLKQRSHRSFYVSSNYRGNKPKPLHVLRRRNYRPTFPAYQQQVQTFYY